MSLLAFHGSIGLAPKIRGCRSRLREEAGEDRLDQGAEDNLGAVCHWEGHPEDEDELEDIVEGCHNVSTVTRTHIFATYETSRRH